ncbi:MAG: hypothetical protein ACK56F_19770, partial [bacterium]
VETASFLKRKGLIRDRRAVECVCPRSDILKLLHLEETLSALNVASAPTLPTPYMVPRQTRGFSVPSVAREP